MPTIDPEFRDLIPPLTAEERAGLEASIRAEGCRDPLVVWSGQDIIIDGHNRHAICEAHGLPYNTIGLALPDRDAAKEWIVRNQFARRNLPLYLRAVLVLKLRPIIAARAEARMNAGKADPVLNSAQGKTRDELARMAEVSPDTLERVRYLHERADDETKDRLRRGETSINAEYTRMKTPGRILSSASAEWYTPALYVEAARRVLGEIDLDPASCEAAQRVINAKRFFTREDDGLAHDWPGRVWMNPPYCGLAGPFAERLVDQYRRGITSAAVLLLSCSTINAKYFLPFWRLGSVCVPDHRIDFLAPDGKESSSNIGGHVLIYLGPHEDRFAAEFEQFGPVVRAIVREPLLTMSSGTHGTPVAIGAGAP